MANKSEHWCFKIINTHCHILNICCKILILLVLVLSFISLENIFKLQECVSDHVFLNYTFDFIIIQCKHANIFIVLFLGENQCVIKGLRDQNEQDF